MNLLRPISVVFSFAKIADKVISSYIIEDMTKDKRQYGNLRGVSVNHYLINMINKILSSVDKNTATERNSVILSMLDASQAFECQSHIFGIQSLIKIMLKSKLKKLVLSRSKKIRKI